MLLFFAGLILGANLGVFTFALIKGGTSGDIPAPSDELE